MEDSKRGMETNERVISSPKRSANNSQGLTVMVLGNVGKVRSFKLSGRSVMWVVIFLLLYIPVSVLTINEYFELNYIYKEKIKELKQIQKDLNESRLDLQRSEHRAALWEDFVNNLQQRLEQEEEETVSQEKESQAKTAMREVEPELAKEEPAPKVVDTQDMVIQKEGSYIVVDFKLVNLLPDEKALGGYIHIIAESRYHDPPQVWTYPKVILENGLPKNFKRGELFIIRRFKPIHGRIDLVSSDVPPSIIRVLVYDQSGTLILRKEFTVGNES